MSVLRAPPTPAAAYFAERDAIGASAARLRAFQQAVADPVSLDPAQYAQWFAYVLYWQPDLVVELGRAYGNSTTVFAEAMHRLGRGRVVSLCLSRFWEERTVPRLRPLVDERWWRALDARRADLTALDFAPLVGDARRVLVLWDAHGFAVAAAVLGKLMPVLAEREHCVLVHDVSDRRYCANALEYGERGIFRGQAWAEANGRNDCRYLLGWIDTVVEQPLVIVDFLTRNRTELHSADHSFHQEIGADADKLAAMQRALPGPEFSLNGHWAYFSLNGVAGPHTFPRVLGGAPVRRRLLGRLLGR
jgi:hypothetical protein